MQRLPRRRQIGDQPIDPVPLRDKIIIAAFKPDILIDQEKSRHPDGEPDDIQRGIAPVPPQTAESDLEVIFEHSGRLTNPFGAYPVPVS